jgi:hypothetical protein
MGPASTVSWVWVGEITMLVRFEVTLIGLGIPNKE